ncbi:MAG: hypothetical protein EOO92_28550 [Pedobacter sp.]|nr:MAG: hypothetical protein EOO92_28550 [Pedobacter sp.]
MKKIIYMSIVLLMALSSCKNEKWEFPDYETQSVYFAYQGPIRTITLGEDIFDTTLDNQHKLQIMGTVAGVYANKEAYQAHLLTKHFLKYKSGTKDMVKSLQLIETVPIALQSKLTTKD